MTDTNLVARMAVEYWKLLRAFERTLERVPDEHKSKTAAQIRFSLGRLESFMKEASLNLVIFEGQKFEANLPATAVNGDDFDGEHVLFVESTIEPAIVNADMTVVSMGKVILTKGAN